MDTIFVFGELDLIEVEFAASDGLIGRFFDGPSGRNVLHSNGIGHFVLEFHDFFFVEHLFEEAVEHGFVDYVLDPFVLHDVAADSEDPHLLNITSQLKPL